MIDWEDVIDTAIAYAERHGYTYYCDKAALRNEVQAFFSRTGDEARRLPVDRVCQIIRKYQVEKADSDACL